MSGYDYFPENQQGYLTDSMKCLTYAGAWQNESNSLYLWMLNSSNPSGHLIEAKKRQLAFDLRNKNYINLVGLKTFGASTTMYNANNCIIDTCQMSYISHFLLWDDSRDGYIDDHTKQTSTSAPQRGEVGIYVGGSNNTINNSTIAYSAGSGLFLAGLNTTVYNNNIHDCGYSSTYLGCVFISYDPTAGLNAARGGHAITYNNIYNAGRSCISFSSQEQQTPYIDSTISNNRLHDACILGSDGGIVYSFMVSLNANTARTQVFNNLMYNVWGKYWCGIEYADNYTYGRNHFQIVSAETVMDLIAEILQTMPLGQELLKRIIILVVLVD